MLDKQVLWFASAEGQSLPQELEEGLRSRPYLLARFEIAISIKC